MSNFYPPVIKKVEKSDPKLYQQISSMFDLIYEPGELDAKTKMLISLALDASVGSLEGVKILSKVARKNGITDAEIAETLRCSIMVAVNRALATTNAAYEE